MHNLVSTEWLAAALGDADVKAIDATLLDPGLGRDARAEFVAGHIRGAVFLDLASLRDTASALPNTFPDGDLVAERLSALGVTAEDRIVLYDQSPWRTAARAWFVLRHHGARQVAILDGGLARWRAEGRRVEAGDASPTPVRFTPAEPQATLRTLADMQDNLGSGAEQVLDARSAGRFSGVEPDPHGIAAGHIPGSHNLPYSQLFEPDGRWKRGAALVQAFADVGIDLGRPIVTTCGSGITAAVLAFGLHLLGRDAALYDGSWSEWGADPNTPKVTA